MSSPPGATHPNPSPDIETYLPIADYALLSDCHSTALVSRNGSIDWTCLRRFDAPSAFARLLDYERGGYFSIVPQGRVLSTARRYLDNTMVLDTTVTVESGTMVITDGFAMRLGGSTEPHHTLIRRVVCTSGIVTVDVTVVPRFDYGSSHPWLHPHSRNTVSAVAGDEALVIHSGIELTPSRSRCEVTASHTLQTDQSFTVSMVSQRAHELDPTAIEDPDTLLDDTIQWWQNWSKDTVATGPYAELLNRSALVLKALCCAPTGAIIAAPTTSLPEIPGGTANWDYRYCWIRDATLTLEALSMLGHREVADGFRAFLMRSAAGHGDELQIMYGCYGERRLPEIKLDLQGWRHSAPVRVGNGAASQTQLDMYGHILRAVHLWQQQSDPIDRDEWEFISSLVDIAARRWTEADAGIWEIRGEPRHFVHSKAMVWVALDRGIELAKDRATSDDVLQRWSDARDLVRAAIERRGVDPVDGHFVQHFGSAEVDASLLQLALVGFIDPNDPRMTKTVDLIQRNLAGPNGFIRRYRSTPGVDTTVSGDDEGFFLLCTCWLVEVLAMQGRTAEAKELFDRVVTVGNDVGLFAEEYDAATGELLGNFPQAFTHLGLIAAANRLGSVRPMMMLR